jgi:hypothetical protein
MVIREKKVTNPPTRRGAKKNLGEAGLFQPGVLAV